MTSSLTHQDSILISATPESVYETVSDITRTGEWSPVCKECWWDEGAGPQVGSYFTGRNVTPDRTWETRSKVVSADPGRSFGWSVADGRVFWTYTMRTVDGGTEVTESWEFTAEGQEFIATKYPDSPEAEIEKRQVAAETGIPATLAALKRIIERGR